MTIAVVHGPNLNRLGARRPERYGHETLADLTDRLDAFATTVDLELAHFQSNHEGAIVDWLHEHADIDGIVLNPAGLTPYGRPLADAVFDVGCPVAIVHITQMYKHYGSNADDLFKAAADVYVCGLGLFGYIAAIVRIRQLIDAMTDTLADAQKLLNL